MPRKRLPTEERKKEIVACAVKVFARSNYRSTRMGDIAAEVGISEAAIYRHFPSKKAVYLAILRHMSERIVAFWGEETEREPDAVRALRNMGLAYFRRMTRHPDELKVQFQAIAEVGDPEIAERLRQDHEQYMSFIAKVLRRGQEQGRVRRDVDVETLSWLFDGVGILLNTTNLLSFKNGFDESAVQKLLDHLLGPISLDGSSE